MVKVLHRHLAGQIGKKGHHEIRAIFGPGITQGRHFFGEFVKPVETLDRRSGRRFRWTLRDCVNTDATLGQMVAVTPNDAF